MKKLRTKNGLIAYHTTLQEIQILGGIGTCDKCNRFSPYGGYLIPVLKRWQCEKCFNEWKEQAEHYPEDDPFETSMAAFYETKIPITDWPQECVDCPCADENGHCAADRDPLDGTTLCDHLDYEDLITIQKDENL